MNSLYPSPTSTSIQVERFPRHLPAVHDDQASSSQKSLPSHQSSRLSSDFSSYN